MKMDKDDCVFYTNSPKQTLWSSFAKHIFDAEKKSFFTKNNDHIEFAKQVMKALRSDSKRYLLLCDYLDFEEKVAIAKSFNIRLPFSLKKPSGNIIYEYSTGETMVNSKSGYFLFDDGRFYEFCGKREIFFNPNRNIVYKIMYKRVGKKQDLSKEIFKFISQNKDAINSLPSKADALNFYDGYSRHYTFFKKQCDGYMMEYAEKGKGIIKWGNEIESIIKKYGFNINPTSDDNLRTFIKNTRILMNKIDSDKSFEKGFEFLDLDNFERSCVGFGYDLLDGNIRRFIDDVGPHSFDELTDKQFLGSIIRSVWKYHKNAKARKQAKFNTNWFRWAFSRLEKII